MCPMRVFLVFFSAMLAAYITWRSVQTSSEIEDTDDLSTSKQESSMIKMVQNAVFVFIDMASGKYLWRNLRQMSEDGKTKSY
ncbi:hypothetical protein Ccrd_013221 [Cynara cardunculus var. scolymus]|uniref:Methyltransferase-related protein n=1 Tax=Cynara cardunculus var. scolymus TaxID=59895 RepID=A0A103YG33_CYNCS|nr:hypothetical protein Ccrd_013221 [Cynara cardunculus var. scolymus]